MVKLAVIALLVFTVVSLCATVLIALRVCAALEKAFPVLDSMQARHIELLGKTLDRLMSRDLDHFKTYDLIPVEEHEVEETPLEDLQRARPWTMPANGVVPAREGEFDPEAEGLPK